MWPKETRKKALSCGVNIFTDDYFVLSGFMHVTDGQTDVDSKMRSNEVSCVQKTHKKLPRAKINIKLQNPGLVAFYDILPGMVQANSYNPGTQHCRHIPQTAKG